MNPSSSPVIQLLFMIFALSHPQISKGYVLIDRKEIQRETIIPAGTKQRETIIPAGTVAAPVFSIHPTEFLAKLSVGTPPVDTLLSVDTGSDHITVQCSSRYSNRRTPKYDPRQSATYVADHDQCPYSTGADTFYMDPASISFDKVRFECSGEGIVGLSGGPSSLISQMGLARKFSYCFKPQWGPQPKGHGHLFIGEGAHLFGNESALTVASAPTRPSALQYFVTLDGISIGSERLNIPPGTFHRKPDGSGGTVIDTGSVYTYLNGVAFDIFLKRLREIVEFPEFKEVRDDPRHALCYLIGLQDLMNYVPYVTLHFSNLDVRLNPLSTFIETPKGRMCLAMGRAEEGEISIIGSYAQQNKNVGFDLDKEVFTMAIDHCTIQSFYVYRVAKSY